MAKNFDEQDDLIRIPRHMEELKIKHGSLIQSHLQRIGTTFANSAEANCGSSRDKAINRFQIFEANNGYSIFLWHGTSKLIDCDIKNYPDVDDFWKYEKDGNDKVTRIHQSFKSDSLTVVSIDILDTLGIFPKEYKSFHHLADDISIIVELIEKLTTSITTNSEY